MKDFSVMWVDGCFNVWHVTVYTYKENSRGKKSYPELNSADDCFFFIIYQKKRLKISVVKVWFKSINNHDLVICLIIIQFYDKNISHQLYLCLVTIIYKKKLYLISAFQKFVFFYNWMIRKHLIKTIKTNLCINVILNIYRL